MLNILIISVIANLLFSGAGDLFKILPQSYSWILVDGLVALITFYLLRELVFKRAERDMASLLTMVIVFIVNPLSAALLVTASLMKEVVKTHQHIDYHHEP